MSSPIELWKIGLVLVVLFGLAYVVYGRLLSRWFRLDAARRTPAEELEDGLDYVPTRPFPLLAQHFSAISAAGPIIGPIVAAAAFGWLPGLLWILFGCIFVGAAHDFAALIASVRHRARSVAEIVREHVGTPAFLLFITFIWLALVLVIINFTDVTAQLFVLGNLEDSVGAAPGPGVASSSMMYLALAILMGLAARRPGLSMKVVWPLGAVLLFVVIWLGQKVPLALPDSWGPQASLKFWHAAILLYCAIASVLPMPVFLQPRGFLGGLLLYAFLAVGVLGLFLGGQVAHAPAWIDVPAGAAPLLPFLFVRIACGACSGFHGLVCSGTTSKQLANERHAHPVGYGGMLLEGMVAVIALATFMLIPAGAVPLKPGSASPDANRIFAGGIASFAESVLGIDRSLGMQFGFLALATFIYDTLDVCTRLGRYLVQELWSALRGRTLDRFSSTAVTVIVPGVFLLSGIDYATAWGIFGASNQLLAALSLLGIAVWLRRSGQRSWFALVPMAFVMTLTVWALGYDVLHSNKPLLRILSAILLVVAAAVVALAARPLLGRRPRTDRLADPAQPRRSP